MTLRSSGESANFQFLDGRIGGDNCGNGGYHVGLSKKLGVIGRQVGQEIAFLT